MQPATRQAAVEMEAMEVGHRDAARDNREEAFGSASSLGRFYLSVDGQSAVFTRL